MHRLQPCVRAALERLLPRAGPLGRPPVPTAWGWPGLALAERRLQSDASSSADMLTHNQLSRQRETSERRQELTLAAGGDLPTNRV